MEHAVKKLFKLLMVIQIFKIAIFKHVYVGSFTKTLLYSRLDGKEMATNTKCIINSCEFSTFYWIINDIMKILYVKISTWRNWSIILKDYFLLFRLLFWISYFPHHSSSLFMFISQFNVIVGGGCSNARN